MTKIYATHRAPRAIRRVPLSARVMRTADRSVLRRILRSPASASRGRESAPAPRYAESYIASLPGRGHALPPSVRAHVEPRFGADFSAVRVHTDRDAAESARALNARAYTYGHHVVFDAGQYAPDTHEGRRLIAHELTHVVQQQHAPAAAQRVMRNPYPNCDKKTTGVADADAQIDSARQEALDAIRAARSAFPKMSTRTIRLLNRHFHCPSHSDIGTIIGMLGKIEKAISALAPNCAGTKESVCQDAGPGRVGETTKQIDFCPPAFQLGPKKAFHFAGFFISGAAQTEGAKRDCPVFDPCYDDFTKPPADMVGNASSYAGFALELAGNALPQPATIPCAPHDTGELVAVPPGATDPTLIRRVTGFDPIPPDSRILSVFKDDSGHRFIYHDNLPGAQQFLPGESKRYYLP
ncbi:MAG: DUF4157 domain-containing protein [Sulfurifustaceae bacterium]